MVSVKNFTDIQDEAVTWRRYLHGSAELDYRVFTTAKFVAEKLASFDINQIETGIAETGIVALIQGQGGDDRAAGRHGRSANNGSAKQAMGVEEPRKHARVWP